MRLLVPIAFAFSLAAQPPAAVPMLRFDANGLSSLQFEGVEYLARGAFEINQVAFRSPSGQVQKLANAARPAVEAQARQVRFANPWGDVIVNYLPAPNTLSLHIRTVNRTQLPLVALSYDALAVRLPGAPREYNGSVPLLATNIGAPTIVPLTYRTGALILCNEDIAKPLLAGFPWALDRPANTIFPLRINTGRDGMYPDSLPSIDRPIAPGASDTFELSLRFVPAARDKAPLAPTLSALFGRLHPYTLNWADRRPIGSLILATAAAHYPHNPRGWFLDPKLDVTTPAGLCQFQKQLLAWADRSIAILQKMNAQGMITWDMEGEQFSHATTYIGDPRVAERLAPEMRGVLDEYFARYRRAGLRVGVTIRPQSLRISNDNQQTQQSEPADPAQVLIDKIAYARSRWGATLFYIDSNGDPALPLPFSAIDRVARTFPDVLLIPEQKNALYYSKTAPYSELRGGHDSTPPLVKSIYPQAFSVINVADGALSQHLDALRHAVSQGDILLFRAWFDDPENQRIAQIIQSGR